MGVNIEADVTYRYKDPELFGRDLFSGKITATIPFFVVFVDSWKHNIYSGMRQNCKRYNIASLVGTQGPLLRVDMANQRAFQFSG